MNINLLFLIIILNIIPFLIGRKWNISELEWYKQNKLPQILPGYYFGIIWTILYTFMAISLYKILLLPTSNIKTVTIIFFVIQLLLNYSFTPIFVSKQLVLSNYIILLTLLFASITTVLLLQLDLVAGILFIPYLVWLIQALYFNNRLAELVFS